MKKLNDLYPGIGTDFVIRNIRCNPSEVEKDDLFVCTIDSKLDRHNCIEEAIRNGASTIIVSKDIVDPRVAIIKVPDTNREFPYLCQKFYDFPDKKLKMIGVVGTDGKTSTGSIIQSLLGISKTGFIGTMGRSCAAFNDNRTTKNIDAARLYDGLEEFVKFGCGYAVVESSNSDIASLSLAALNYDVLVFTNLANEYLDDNEKFVEYFNTMSSLFSQLKEDGWCILNGDDPYFESVKSVCRGNIVTYGRRDDATLQIVDYSINNSKTLIKFKYNNEEFDVLSSLLGEFNIYNLAAAILCVLTIGYRKEEILNKISDLVIPGRMEMLKTDANYYVMVDYAHTVNSIVKLVNFVHTLGVNNIIIVLGAVMDKDSSMLASIGSCVCEMANNVIFTYDDPNDMAMVNSVNIMYDAIKEKYNNMMIVPDRKLAIRNAIEIAKDRDIVLLLGKGREIYQKLEFNDVDVCYQEIVNRKIKEENS